MSDGRWSDGVVSMSSTQFLGLAQGWTAQDHADVARDLVFVQMARSFGFTGSAIDLLDLSPITLCIGPPPARSLGHVTTGALLDLWSSDDAGSGAPRQAVIALVDHGIRPWSDTPLLLTAPRIHDSGLRYDVRLVDGVLPPTSGACVLFIAGAHRKDGSPDSGVFPRQGQGQAGDG